MTAIAAHEIVGFQDFVARSPLFSYGYADAIVALLDVVCRPAEARLDGPQSGHFPAQHFFHAVLRQPFVVLKIVWAHDLSSWRSVPVIAHQAAVGRHLTDRIAGRHEARGPYLVDYAPEIKMLERALSEILPFGDLLQSRSGLNDRAGYASQSQIHGKRDAHRTAAHDNDLVPAVFSCQHDTVIVTTRTKDKG